MERLTHAAPETLPIDAFVAQADRLIEQAALREQKIAAARSQISSVLKDIGETLPDAARKEMELFARSGISDDTPEQQVTLEQQVRQQAEASLAAITGSNTSRIVKLQDRFDLEMAGDYTVRTTWLVARSDTMTLIEKASQEKGYTNSRGHFDRTAYRTFIVSPALTYPLIAEHSLSVLQSGPSHELNARSFKLGSWFIVGNEVRRIAQKAECDDIAAACIDLLKDIPYGPGQWPGSSIKQLVVGGKNDSPKWTLTQSKVDTNPDYDEIVLRSEGPGDFSRSARLRIAEGTIQSHQFPGGLTLRTDEETTAFVRNLDTFKALLAAEQQEL